MKINATDITPYFELNEKKGTIEITGISKVVDAMAFFKPIIDAVDLYIKEDQLSGDIWDASGYMWESTHAGFAADQTFDEVLTYWQA